MIFDNIYDDILIDKKNEQFIDLIKNENVRIEKIVSNGQSSPKDFWYCQDENEFVIILKGEAILEFENEKVPMLEGDFINIPSKTKHRVEYTLKDGVTIWLAVFYN
ncbi:cupin domain-containing protein [Campylobacterota bacterium DY0563]